MSQTKKSLQDLTLLDRFLFAEVMEDAETFENVLSIILGQDISIKGHPQSEHEKRTSPLKRQVRLDVWAEDCLLYTSPSPRDLSTSRMPSSA